MKRERESASGAKIHAKLFVRYKFFFFLRVDVWTIRKEMVGEDRRK